jgi:DNA-binding MarR family transcriptional regulator
VAKDTCVPGKSEALVDVYIERSEDDQDTFRDYVVEAAPKFRERYSLLVASTLVDANAATTCRIRILNPMPDDVTLRQETEVGIAERADRIVSVIAKAECPNSENSTTVRRIRLVNDTSVDANTGSLPRANAAEVPGHLKDLYEKSTSGRSAEESEIIAGVLAKFAGTFSRDDWDLGLTHLLEHSINTGDAAPVKQRPPRVPMANADDERKAIDELLQMGVIRKSTSPWASPIVLVRKTVRRGSSLCRLPEVERIGQTRRVSASEDSRLPRCRGWFELVQHA